jgi:signal transduction histidine kinase
VEENSIFGQVALALPVVTALVLFTLLRSERKPVHLMMAALLASIIPWLVGMAMRTGGGSLSAQEAGLDLEHVSGFWMPALFAISMGYFARLRAFESSPGPAAAFLCSAPLFTALYLIDGIQPLYFLDRSAALHGGAPELWAGPFYWATKTWALVLNGSAFTFLGIALFRGRTAQERKRAATLVAAAGAPLAAHFAFVVGINPLGEALTPLALVFTAAAFVHGTQRHGLLDGTPLIRSDVIDHLHEGLVVTNEQGVVVDLNERAVAALDVQRDVVIGSRLADLLCDSAGRERAEEVAARVITLSPVDEHLSIQLTRADGRVLELSAGAVRGRGYQPAGRIVLLRDRSEQRRAELLLREHQKRESVGILAAGVAHEVNNPLAYVRSNLSHVQLLVDEASKQHPDGGGADEWRELPDVLNDTVEGLDRIEQIVKSLIRFSAPPDEDFQSVDVETVVEDSLRLANLHRASEVRISRQITVPLQPVYGSANRLVQAVLNLLLNARQALVGREDPRLSVETELESNRVIVRVRDNGPGIAAEHRDRIFDPFFTTRAPDAGTGLGLSISFDIAREHGGTLELEPSESGACFALKLPIARQG